MGIAIYKAGKKATSYLRYLHNSTMQNVKYGSHNINTKVITKWQFPGQEAHAGQVLKTRHNAKKNIRTIETAFAGRTSNSKLQPYMRETISEDKFTREKIADVMFSSANGEIERFVAKPNDPALIKFVKGLLLGNPQAKSMILNRY